MDGTRGVVIMVEECWGRVSGGRWGISKASDDVEQQQSVRLARFADH